MPEALASVSVGDVDVDAVLSRRTVRPGGTVTAGVRVTGGDGQRDLGHVDLELVTRARTENGYRSVEVDRFRLVEGVTVGPGEEYADGTDVTVPRATPLTVGGVDVRVEAAVGIGTTVTPEDTGHLEVHPTDRMRAAFDAADRLGLELRGAECELDPFDVQVTTRRFVQTFDFRPAGGPFADELNGLELAFVPREGELAVFAELDRRDRSPVPVGVTDTGHRRTGVSVTTTDPGVVERRLRGAVTEHL